MAVVVDWFTSWAVGTYVCARCQRPLFASKDKWSGPCVWPSWRRPIDAQQQQRQQQQQQLNTSPHPPPPLPPSHELSTCGGGSAADRDAAADTFPERRKQQAAAAATMGGAVAETFLGRYNTYECQVAEVYCGGCDLFLGHKVIT